MRQTLTLQLTSKQRKKQNFIFLLQNLKVVTAASESIQSRHRVTLFCTVDDNKTVLCQDYSNSLAKKTRNGENATKCASLRASKRAKK